MARFSEGSLIRSADGEVACRLSEREWGVFASSMDCAPAAKELNEAVEMALRTGDSLARTVYPVMARWAAYGASDSEPFNALKDIYEAVGLTAADFNREIREAFKDAEELDAPSRSPGR